MDRVTDVAGVAPLVHIDVYVAGALGHSPAHDVKEQRGQRRDAFRLSRSGPAPRARSLELAAGDHQQERRGEHIAGGLRHAVASCLHHAFDFIDLVAHRVLPHGEDRGYAPFQQYRAQPAGQRGQIEFAVQRANERRIQTRDVFR
ncbi:hypothetical protein D3C72_1726120 [compost metagenome]